MKTVIIYAVISSQGSYDDYYEHIEKCFTNKDEAYKYAKEIDESHIYNTPIPEEIMDEVDEHFYDDFFDPNIKKFCDEYNIPNNDDILHRTNEQQKMFINYRDELDEHYDDWCKEYLLTHYDGKYTVDDYNKYLEYIEHRWEDWHDCKIKELELAIDDEFKN